MNEQLHISRWILDIIKLGFASWRKGRCNMRNFKCGDYPTAMLFATQPLIKEE